MSSLSEKISEHRYPLILLAGIIILYAQTLSFDFVNYDDYDLVYQNGDYLGNISNIVKSFTTHAFTYHREVGVYYRPILLVSYIVDFTIWKLNPFGYHLTNVLIHCLSALLLFKLAETITNNKKIALMTGLLFALHPIQTSSVAWIAGRNDVIVGLFVISMMYFYVLHYERKEKSKTYLYLSILSYALALFTKESGAFFIGLIPLYDLVMRKQPFGTLLSRASLIRYAPFVGFFVLYLLIRLSIFGEFIGAEKLYGKIPMNSRFQVAPALMSENLSYLIFPFNLSIVRPLDELYWLESPWNYVSYIIVLGFGGLIFWSWKRQRVFCFGLLWLAIAFIPILNIFPVAVPILEHRLYTATAGFALLGMVLLSNAGRHSVKLFYVIGSAIILLAFLGSFSRLPVWKNSETLWIDAIAKEPKGSRSYFNLAGYYYEKQQYDKSIELMITYNQLRPDDYLGLSKLRQTYLVAGKRPEAGDVSRQMIALNPHNPNRYIEAGMLYESFNMPDSAIAIYHQGIAADSTFYQLYARIGTVYEQTQKDPQRAAPYYFTAIRMIETKSRNFHPPSEVIELLKYLYERTGQTAKAQALQ